jgi:hypothetical protein
MVNYIIKLFFLFVKEKIKKMFFVRGKVHGIQVVGVRYMKKSLVCELRKIALGEEKT